ncbi:hypothetical protein CATMIT_01650, partial [Catenibacterium mitsuokai DSM 15897]
RALVVVAAGQLHITAAVEAPAVALLGVAEVFAAPVAAVDGVGDALLAAARDRVGFGAGVHAVAAREHFQQASAAVVEVLVHAAEIAGFDLHLAHERGQLARFADAGLVGAQQQVIAIVQLRHGGFLLDSNDGLRAGHCLAGKPCWSICSSRSQLRVNLNSVLSSLRTTLAGSQLRAESALSAAPATVSTPCS